ncbi:carbamoyl-phosphate synthase large subunit [Rhizomicrobium palustre]|uniref:Carbamoyl-phosphate synthase large subunit n=1 Tax=Rhizomicrobium palustre TaxID=189966 RepID=A0A846MYM7_9PROT|nr:NAD-dependent epimerase/dehydratase family protein [Rhizomicrobium palustre]NIK88067.1 carbamoyl-phosphate synthase large subunit [Rhizomicrobium palustre]
MSNIRKVFVSGGAGVIGREMIPKLVARGFEVMVGDLKPRPEHFPSSVHYRQGDLNHITEGELAAFAPDCFIHLAATFERSTETYGFWEENFWHNVRLSHHLMTVTKDLPSLKRVVFASSYLIYDQALYQFDVAQEKPRTLNESDPILPRNLTGMAKLAHEIELRFLDGFRAEAFTTACARIYRGYGCNSRDVISRWIRMLLAGEKITVYRPEGLFDYIYAKDTAEGLIRLALSDVRGIINLGTGRSRRVADVVEVLRQHFPKLEAETAEADIPFEASGADTSAWQKAIGWLPDYDLEHAIPEMIAFEKTKKAAPPAPVYGNVLVTSASKKVPLVRALQTAAKKLKPEIKVIAGDMNEAALTRYVADDFWRLPRTDAAAVESLIAGCKERGIKAILPTRDGELHFWAEQKARFAAEGIAVLVSPAASITRCLDKLAFARFGLEKGLPFIPTFEAPQGDGPFVVKERFGAGSRGLGLNLSKDAALAHGAKLEAPIYQPQIRGREISIDAWLDQAHKVKGLVLRGRDSVVDGESQITTTFRDAGLEKAAATILEALELSGPVVMQAFVVDGKLAVIECNPRFGGASTTSIAAGLDSFTWSLTEAFGGGVAALSFDRVPGEVRQIRVPGDIYVFGPDL